MSVSFFSRVLKDIKDSILRPATMDKIIGFRFFKILTFTIKVIAVLCFEIFLVLDPPVSRQSHVVEKT